MLLAQFLASCSDDIPPAPPSKSEFVAEANAICGEPAKLVAAVSVDLGESPTSDEVDDFVLDTFVPAIRDEVASIRSLGLPSADTNQLQGVLFDIEAVLDELTTNPDEVLDRRHDAFDDINRRLDEYGLTTCGSGTATSSGTTSTVRDMTPIQDLPELDTFSAEFQANPHGLLRDALARGPLREGRSPSRP